MLKISVRGASVLLVVAAVMLTIAMHEGNVVQLTETVVALLIAGQLYAGAVR